MATPDRLPMSSTADADPDERALDGLYRSHAAWLTAVLRRRLGALAAEAEDIVQEAYLRIARYQAAGRVAHPKALLLTIARNLARDRARAVARRPAVGGDAAAARLSEMPTPGSQEADLLLKEAVLALPEPLRDVFVLSRFTTMSYEEIAMHCGISVKTVEWRISRALTLCANRLRG